MARLDTTRIIDGYLTGQLLVAMPSMSDPRFERTVIYLCAHSDGGALGLVINRLAEHISFDDLLGQLNIPMGPHDEIRVHLGGPVEQARGFVLHSADYVRDNTLVVSPQIALTASVDVLAAIAAGHGPRRSLLALGYAGWGPGQLEAEIQQNGWLQVPADDDLLFGSHIETKWHRAMRKIGLDISALVSTAGHA
jgi:putative transcriptional regulator